jgi:hypothetical protein
MTDQDRIVGAIRDAGKIIAEYIEPGRLQDPRATLDQIIAVLDDHDLIIAMKRLEKGFGLRVVK